MIAFNAAREISRNLLTVSGEAVTYVQRKTSSEMAQCLQPCWLPNAIYCTLPGSPGGCSALAISSSGTLLAAACGMSEGWQIIVLELGTPQTHVLGPHHGRVGQAYLLLYLSHFLALHPEAAISWAMSNALS